MKRPDTKKRTSLGVSQKKQDAALERMLKKRGQGPRTARPQRPVKNDRPLFTYAECLEVGDVIEVHGSREWKPGHWENVSSKGSVLSIDKETNRLYSKTLITMTNEAWPETSEQHSLSNMSYIHLVKDGTKS